MPDHSFTRRDFVATSAKGALAAALVPPGFPAVLSRHGLGGLAGPAPSDRLNIAVAGFGGMGSSNAEVFVGGGHNLVAVCDVDLAFSDKQVTGREKDDKGVARPTGLALRAAFDKAAKYTDFREMLDRQ